jgi:hypothetical protein
MLCFEVYRNGTKLCTAGVGDCGVLTAFVTYVANGPEKLARWAAEGITDLEPVRLNVSVGGLDTHDEAQAGEHLNWIDSPLLAGDEIVVRIVDGAQADPPKKRRRRNQADDLRRREEYVRETAKKLGWEIREPEAPASDC